MTAGAILTIICVTVILFVVLKKNDGGSDSVWKLGEGSLQVSNAENTFNGVESIGDQRTQYDHVTVNNELDPYLITMSISKNRSLILSFYESDTKKWIKQILAATLENLDEEPRFEIVTSQDGLAINIFYQNLGN